jgi:TonB family protein
MMPLRERERALPLIITLEAHAVLLVVCAIIVVSTPAQNAREIGIDVSLQPDAGSGASEGTHEDSLPMRTIRSVRPQAIVPLQVSGNSLQGVQEREDPLSMASAVEAPSVTPGDAHVDNADQESLLTQTKLGESIGWEGSARTLIRTCDPAFPAQLSAAGQEVECEARITVAASGVVTRVEITRSSGYIEIDASVEAALHDCLFSRTHERKDTVGKIMFRFRLERQD